jgi:hypothetical protein
MFGDGAREVEGAPVGETADYAGVAEDVEGCFLCDAGDTQSVYGVDEGGMGCGDGGIGWGMGRRTLLRLQRCRVGPVIISHSL